MLHYIKNLFRRFFGTKRVKHTAQPPLDRNVD